MERVGLRLPVKPPASNLGHVSASPEPRPGHTHLPSFPPPPTLWIEHLLYDLPWHLSLALRDWGRSCSHYIEEETGLERERHALQVPAWAGTGSV